MLHSNFFQNDKKPLLLLGGLAFLLLFSNLWVLDLLEHSEARYAEAAYEMTKNNNWLTPHILGVEYFHKPPLIFWLVALSYKIFGFSEFSARLPSALISMISVYICYSLSKALFDRKTAFYACLILLLSPLFFAASHTLNFDIFLLFFSVAIIFYFYKITHQDKSFLNLIIFYTLIGFSFLIKGPVIFIIITAPIVFLWKNRNLHNKQSLHFKIGLIVILGISIPWYLFQYFNNHELLKYFLTQLTSRITSAQQNSYEISMHKAPFYYYIPIIFGGFFPWILFLFSKKNKYLTKDKNIKLLFYWFIIPFILFSLFTGKLIYYIVPTLIPLSIITARMIVFSKSFKIVCILGVICLPFFLTAPYSVKKLNPTFNIYKSAKSFQKVLKDYPNSEVLMIGKVLYAVPFYTQKEIAIFCEKGCLKKINFDSTRHSSDKLYLEDDYINKVIKKLQSRKNIFCIVHTSVFFTSLQPIAKKNNIELYIHKKTKDYILVSNFK
ncbi:MAG: glycosyltransferase family 39 protein [Deltaproteobacteria bacterium]|nr:glycosyltransferase family 39 protein [Deltaproteobacteria bacterium]